KYLLFDYLIKDNIIFYYENQSTFGMDLADLLMVRGNTILHYLKLIGLVAVVIMIWLTSERSTEPPRFSTGQPKSTGGFINGKAEGTWTWWYENGTKMTEGNFEEGKRNGLWNTWYENGVKKSEGQYVDDK